MSPMEQFARFLAEKGIAFAQNVPLARLCTFRIGGPAALVAEPAGTAEIAAVQTYAKSKGIPTLVLGRGSNILFGDEGFSGAVIHLGQKFSRVWDTDEVTIRCESGLKLAALCEHALARGLAGLEFAYGIPGAVGGAVYMNAGAYGGEIKDVLLRAEHLEPDGSGGILEGEALGLSYRRSAYTDGDRVITGAAFRLTPGDPAEIKAKMDDYMNRRRTKQPLEYPSAGSTFRRPAGNYASALIDQCGLKGRRVGGAVVSEKHAGFVVNDGGATAKDVRELIGEIQRKVLAQTGYRLECEVKLI